MAPWKCVCTCVCVRACVIGEPKCQMEISQKLTLERSSRYINDNYTNRHLTKKSEWTWEEEASREVLACQKRVERRVWITRIKQQDENNGRGPSQAAKRPINIRRRAHKKNAISQLHFNGSLALQRAKVRISQCNISTKLFQSLTNQPIYNR